MLIASKGAFGLTEVHHSWRQRGAVRGLDWSRADHFIQLGAEFLLSADGLSDVKGLSASGHGVITLAEESKAAMEPQWVDADKSNLKKPSWSREGSLLTRAI